MTRGELRDRILTGLNESTSAPVFWSAAQINQTINEGLELISEEAEAVKRTAFVALRPGTTYYSTRGIAPDMFMPWRLWLHTTNRRLTATSASELDRDHETWETVSGVPEWWFPMGWDWFGVWPKATTGGGVLRVDYFSWPRALEDDSDEPELYLNDHEGLIFYGVYDGLLKRWDLERALGLWALFLGCVGDNVGRTGILRQQARTFQSGAFGGTELKGNLGDRFGGGMN